MEFPVAGVPVALWSYLFGLGFVVGVCGGFWGMGGGWMIIPALQAMGVPVSIAIGTSVCQIMGNSLMSTMRHWKLGNVELKIAFVMLPGQLLGVELGVRLIEYLKAMGGSAVEIVVGYCYLVVLFGLAGFMTYDIIRNRRNARQNGDKTCAVGDEVSCALSSRVQSINIRPCVCCDVAGIPSISVWVILGIGILMGIMTGFLGVGGGLIGMPLLVYVIGCQTPVAVGTSMACVIFGAVYGTFSHALQMNVDLPMALCILAGASTGVQLGALATRYAEGDRIRGLFAAMAAVVGLSVILNTYLHMKTAALVLVLGFAGTICLIIIYLLICGLHAKKAQSLGSSSP